jgi:hypothetical protein
MGKGLLGEIVSALYKASRICGKSASTMNTVKTVLSGDPQKIAKHFARKAVYKEGHKLSNKIAKKIK